MSTKTFGKACRQFWISLTKSYGQRRLWLIGLNSLLALMTLLAFGVAILTGELGLVLPTLSVWLITSLLSLI